MHHREHHRPSSTGHLVARVIQEAHLHLWRRERRITVGEIRRPGRELWILHPNGHPVATPVQSANIQVVLIDGTWSETTAISQEISGWGRLVSLPLTGVSRYWLRTQQDGGRFSTAEALLGLFALAGHLAAHAALRLQLELHVYANLRARGRKDMASLFLENSSLLAGCPEMLAALNERRSR